jgi:glyoxylase-like metal-dependent hydrolase (beta-lactamase superfamily II)
MRFGNLALHLLSDGTFRNDGGGLFGLVPRVLWEQVAAPDERNCILLGLHCLLVDNGRQRILVDTGIGDKLPEAEQARITLSGRQRLLRSLETVGVRAQDIDLVINTHLHFDHCGGNTHYNDEGEAVPAFPRATYCIQRLELADATFPNEWTQVGYHRQDWEPVSQAGQLRILSGDTRVTDEVRVEVMPGHTRAHQCVVVESAGQTALYLGDVAAWPIHMERLAWVSAYDVEPMTNIETKRKLARWAIENHVLLIFNHHPEILAGYLHTTERPDHFYLEPVEMEP